MADRKVSQLDPNTAPTVDDLLYVVDDPGGTPLSKRMTIGQLGPLVGGVPLGCIVMWGGAIASIPANWALCDGIANSPGPDLRDRFVVGARADQTGVAKSNVEGTLKQTGGVTAVQPSAHAALSHTGGAVADHVGLTHGLTIADHPDLTHPALSHPPQTLTHPQLTIPTASGSQASHAAGSLPSMLASRPSLSIASHALATMPSRSIPSGVDVTVQGYTPPSTGPTLQGGAISVAMLSFPTLSASRASLSMPSIVGVSVPSTSIAAGIDVSVPSQANLSMPSASHSHASVALNIAAHSMPSSSHQDIGVHAGSDYGSHLITPPAAHGVAGTITHAFTEPDPHTISAHDALVTVPVYFALAFIQRMA